MDDGKKSYKSPKELIKIQKNRSERSMRLRKMKRVEVALKQRNIPKVNQNWNSKDDNDDGCNGDQVYNLEQLAKLASDSSNRENQLSALRSIRNLISSPDDQVIRNVIETNIVPTLIDCLENESELKIQLEAAWILTNMASGSAEDTYTIIRAGVMPALLTLLSSESVSLREQAIWAFGNIVGNGSTFRNYVLQMDILSPILAFVDYNTPEAILNNVGWLILNLSRFNDPPLPIVITHQILNAIFSFFQQNNNELVVNLVWALSYIAESGEEQIQLIIDYGFIPIIIPFLSSMSYSSIMAALRAIGNIVNGSNDQAQIVINHGVFEHFPSLLQHPNTEINQQVVFILANISVGNLSQNQSEITDSLIESMIILLKNSNFEIQKEIIWSLRNIIRYCEVRILFSVLKENIVPILCKILTCKDSDADILVLEIFNDLIERCSSERREVAFLIEIYGGRQSIESLQVSDNFDISKLAHTLIDKYFLNNNHDHNNNEITMIM